MHYFLVKLLEKHGLKYADVQSVFLALADARAAFEKGAVDAWIIWDPFLASAQKTLGARILADATGVVNNRAYYFSSARLCQPPPRVLRIAVEEINAIDRWASKNKDAAATELSAVLGLDTAITRLYLDRAQFGTAPVTREILASEQQAIADAFFDLKLIPKSSTCCTPRPWAVGPGLRTPQKRSPHDPTYLEPPAPPALQLLGVTAFHWALASRYANAQSPAVPGPEQLRIGYQKSAVNLVILKQQGVLESAFPARG